MITPGDVALERRRSNAMGSQPSAADHRRLRGILHLTEAATEAHAAGSDIWQYAVPIDVLRLYTRLTDADVHWLIGHGFAEHGVETTKNGSKVRVFRSVGRLNAAADVCFIASRTAFRLVENFFGLLQQVHGLSRNPKPRWDAHLGKLTFGLGLVKALPESAVSQRKVLDRCEEREWPDVIDSPFSDMPPRERSRYLSRVLNHLNGGQKETHLHFSALDQGRKLRWQAV